jgi:hypothetical protein
MLDEHSNDRLVAGDYGIYNKSNAKPEASAL